MNQCTHGPIVMLPLVLIFILAFPFVSFAEEQEELVPEDTCIVELRLPDGAKVTVDGRDYGQHGRLSFSSLNVNQLYGAKLGVRFPDGTQDERNLLLRGGWTLRPTFRSRHTTGLEVVLQTGHSNGAVCAAIEKGGRYAATAGDDGTIVLWEIRTKRQLRQIGIVSRPMAISFAEDGSTLLVLDGGYDNTSCIAWDVKSGRQLYRLPLPPFECAAFTRNGEQFVIFERAQMKWALGIEKEIREPGIIAVWGTHARSEVRRFEPNTDKGDRVAVSPDGRYLAAAWRNGDLKSGKIFLWDLESQGRPRVLPTGAVMCLAFAPDGNTLAAGLYEEKKIVFWNSASGQESRSYSVSECPECLTFSPDETRMVAASYNHVAVLDLHSGKTIHTLKPPSNIRALTFTQDSTQVLAVGQDCCFWNPTTGEELGRLKSGLDGISCLAMAPNGRYAVVGVGTSGNLWDLPTGSITQFSHSGLQFVRSVAVSPSEHYVALGHGWNSESGGAAIFDMASGRKVKDVGHMQVTAVAFMPDERFLVTSYRTSMTSIVWNLEEGTETRQLGEGGYCLAVSPDGRFALVGHDGTSPEINGPELWDISTGNLVRRFDDSGNRLWSPRGVGFSPDGRFAISGHSGYYPSQRSGVAVIWDVASGARIRDLYVPSGSVSSVQFSSNSRQVLTGSSSEIIVWDSVTGAKLRSLHQPAGAGTTTFCRGGRCILSAGGDNSLHLWDIATGDELASLISLHGGRDWLVVTPDGLFDGSSCARESVFCRVGDGLQLVPVDRFFRDFYHPGLLQDLWDGQRPVSTQQAGQTFSPLVRITSPSSNTPPTTTEITVEVAAVDQGGGISGPWLMHNGARVLASGEPKKDGKTVRREFKVTLIEGENRFEAKAASEDGAWESEPAVIVLKYEKPLLKPELYLVAVGVNRYAEETMNLKFAVADAKAMTELFQKRGPVLYGEGKVHVTQLLDGAATKQGIKKTLGEVAKKARAQDTLVLLLSGHGTMVGQRYYFLPHDFKHGSDDLEDAVRQRGLAGDELDEAVVAVPALKRVLIYDTCQSGGAIGPLRTARSPFAFQKAIEQMSRSQGSFVLAATSAGEEAQESAQLEHGVLTYALLARLGAIDKGPLKDRPSPTGPVVKVRDWCGFAQDEVPDLTKVLFGKKQNVTFKASGNDFPILPSKTDQQGNMK